MTNWAWRSELFEWELFPTDEPVDDIAVFSSFTKAKAALIDDMRNTVWNYHQAINAVRRLTKDEATALDGRLHRW